LGLATEEQLSEIADYETTPVAHIGETQPEYSKEMGSVTNKKLALSNLVSVLRYIA